MSQCDWTCLSCVFRYRLKMYGVICNYIGVTGHMRGCSAGKGCDRKIRGDKLDGLDALLYHMIPAVRKQQKKPQKPPPPPPTPEEIAEKRRKNTEKHRRWVERNREHVRDYQRERRKKAREAAEGENEKRGTG